MPTVLCRLAQAVQLQMNAAMSSGLAEKPSLGATDLRKHARKQIEESLAMARDVGGVLHDEANRQQRLHPLRC